jgi:GTP-binding protein
MQFIDYTKIYVKGGKGGKGCVSFRREKNVPKGGPDGGDGGKGGDIVIRATIQLNTLLDFRYKHEYKAPKGQDGMGKKMHGKNGINVVVPVPVGTVIKSVETGNTLADLMSEGDFFVAAEGGRGGLGNSHFATSTRQVPRYAQPGEDSKEQWLILELKLLADVGLVGLPNAGKSTLISVVSSAKPKIADYPFTTLVPTLGVVKAGTHKSFVIADIPGLIEGAHKGAGLGFQFLRHVERTKILLHLVDISDVSYDNPVEQYEKVTDELKNYSSELMLKTQAIVATKLDIATDRTRLDILEKYCKTSNITFLKISSVTGKGIKSLLRYLNGVIYKG